MSRTPRRRAGGLESPVRPLFDSPVRLLSRWLVGFVVGSIFCAGSVRGETEHLSTDALVARFEAPWPNSLRRGYQPIFVEVANRSTETVDVVLTASGEYWANRPFEVRDRFECAPGAKMARELVVPVPWDAAVRVSVSDGESREGTSLRVGVGEPDDRTAIVSFSSKSKNAENRVEAAILRADLTAYHHEPLRYESMPTRMASYTGLDLVVLDVVEGVPYLERIEALLAYVKTGGVVLLEGSKPEEIASLLPAFAPYLERSRATIVLEDQLTFPCGFGEVWVDTDPGRDSFAGTPGVSAPYGQTLARASYSRDGSVGFTTTISGTVRVGSSTTDELLPMSGRNVPRFAPEVIPSISAPVDALPARGMLIVILFVFTMLVGPVSFFLARKRGTPMLALFFTPAFAFSGALVIFAVSVFSSGLGVKSTSLTMTYLDQRTHRASVVEMRALFSGLSESFSLDGALAACLPDHEPSRYRFAMEHFFPRREKQRDPMIALDVSNGMRHSGGFAPPRRLARQVVLLDTAARGRIDLRYAGSDPDSELLATQALEVDAYEFIVRLAEDDYRFLARGSDPKDLFTQGETRSLVTLPASYGSTFTELLDWVGVEPNTTANATKRRKWVNNRLVSIMRWLDAGGRTLQIGEYLAFTVGPAIPTDEELDPTRVGGGHVVLGAIDLSTLGSNR